MIDEVKARVPLLFSVFLLLTACAVTRNDDAADSSKGEQYLRYGVEAFSAGQPAVARSRFNWALGIFERNGDLDGQTRAHINLAEQAFRSYDITGASAHLRRAEELLSRSGSQVYQRRILLIQSSIALSQRNYGQAQMILNGLLEGAGDQSGHVQADNIYIAALVNRAALSHEQKDGEFSKWVQRLKWSITTSQNGNASVYGRLLRFEAEIFMRKGEYGEAKDSFESAMSAYQAGVDDAAIGSTLREWAQLDIEQGHWSNASDKLRRSILLKDAVGDLDGVIEGLRVLAVVESESGRSDEADVLEKLVAGLQKNRNLHGARVPGVIGAHPDSRPYSGVKE
jgi:tetratricopeptide (TPR) repeat protein